MMEPDLDLRAIKFWTKVVTLALAIDLILLAVDHKLKNDVIKEAKALREEVARVRQGTGGTHTSPPRDRAQPVDAVDHGPPAPPPAGPDEAAGQPETVDGLGRPPSRGGVNARRTRAGTAELRPALRPVAAP